MFVYFIFLDIYKRALPALPALPPHAVWEGKNWV